MGVFGDMLVCRGHFVRHKDLISVNLRGWYLHENHPIIRVTTPLDRRFGSLFVKSDACVLFRHGYDMYSTDIPMRQIFGVQIFDIMRQAARSIDQHITKHISLIKINLPPSP